MFNRLLDRVFGADAAGPGDVDREPDSPVTQIVLSLPSILKGALAARLPGALSTDQVFRNLIESARSSLKIFSPYVDNSFTGMVQNSRVPIQVVTTLRDSKMKSSPVLERFATTRPLAVRYLCEMQGKIQLYQLHAKMILSDSDLAYVGSANFTDTSLHYNFELGICTRDPGLIADLHRLYDSVFESAAKPAGKL